jgi:hypothetical protein
LGRPDFGPNQHFWPNREFDLPLYTVQRLPMVGGWCGEYQVATANDRKRRAA